MAKVPCGDRAAFTAAALALAADQSRCRAVGERARQDMLGNAWVRVVDRFEELLRRTVERNRQDALLNLCA
jgi:hypothetical protein